MENHHLDRATAERCRDAYRERYRTVGLLENRLFPEIPAVLQALKQQGYTLCVATSKPEEFAVRILEHFDLVPYFTVISGATMDGRISTKQQVIENTLRRCGNPPCSQVLMIGDRKHDIEGAHACDIAAIGVLFGFGSQAELEAAGADAIAPSIQSLLTVIPAMNPC